MVVVVCVDAVRVGHLDRAATTPAGQGRGSAAGKVLAVGAAVVLRKSQRRAQVLLHVLLVADKEDGADDDDEDDDDGDDCRLREALD